MASVSHGDPGAPAQLLAELVTKQEQGIARSQSTVAKCARVATETAKVAKSWTVLVSKNLDRCGGSF